MSSRPKATDSNGASRRSDQACIGDNHEIDAAARLTHLTQCRRGESALTIRRSSCFWGAPAGRTGSEAAEAGTSNAVRAAAGRPAGRAGRQHHTTRSARITQRRDSRADIAVVRAGAQDITDHYPNPLGAQAVGHQAKPCTATGLLWVVRGYVKARRAAAIYPCPAA